MSEVRPTMLGTNSSTSQLRVAADWYDRAAADVARLEAAARGLRRLGGTWLFWFMLSLGLALVFMGLGIGRAVLAFGILGLALLGVAGIYFGLAKYVAAGRRWAVACALFFVSLFASMLVFRILATGRFHFGRAIVETLYLVATLNLLKSLILSWGAARRIQRQARLLREGGEVDFEYG